MDNSPGGSAPERLTQEEPDQDHRAEEALRRSEERYRALVEATSQAVWSWSPDGANRDFARTQQWWEELTGQTPEEQSVSTTGWLDVVHPEDRERAGAAWTNAITSGTRYDIEYRVKARAGGWRHIHARGIPIRTPEGSVREWVGTLNDVTEQRKAEAGSRESEELFRSAFEDTHVAMVVTDSEHRFVRVNAAFAKLFGRAREELLSLSMADVTHPDHLAESYARRRPLSSGEADYFQMEKRYLHRDGRVFWGLANVSVVRNAGGKPELYVGQVQDVTGRKAMEDALRDADRKKDEFLALLAHELRNPLAPLRNGLQVLRLAGNNLDTASKARAMMERQLAHMVRLIDDLLDVSRISRNKMELRRSRIALSDVVSSAVETSRPVIEDAGHELIVSMPPEPFYLDADLTRLAQVFSNLLTNSAKYTERGGHIWLTAEPCHAGVAMSVRDTGIGIPARSLATIFDMFSQVDRSLERSTGGLGIGLALVKSLVEMHGGTVTVWSEGQGKGSMFTVTLPTLTQHPEPTPPAMSAPGKVASGSKRRVLVVDDSPDGAESLALLLRLMGNEVRTAQDGLEAVEGAGKFRPEVIIMDVGMPRLNGLDATRRIREHPWGKGITIIALTGWGQEGDKEQSREAGCDGHLVKPVDPSELQNLLERLRAASDNQSG